MITTSRLIIRPFQEQDGGALYEYLSNPLVYRFEPGQPVSREEADDLARKRAEGDDFWAVTLKSTGQLVGHIYFTQIEPKRLMTWELGFIFNPAFHNQGFATEAAAALVRYGFEFLDIHRVVAHCNPQNVASWKVLEKVGMTHEGYFRQNVFFRRDGAGAPLWTDSFAYAILREDLAAGAGG